jgi:hypothetical protein
VDSTRDQVLQVRGGVSLRFCCQRDEIQWSFNVDLEVTRGLDPPFDHLCKNLLTRILVWGLEMHSLFEEMSGTKERMQSRL